MGKLLCITVCLFIAQCANAMERIVIIDSGVNLTPSLSTFLCKEGSVSMDGSSPFVDALGHGTNIMGLITKGVNKDRMCVVVVKLPINDMRMRTIAIAVQYAVRIGAKYINLSLQGTGYIQEEYDAIKLAIDKNIVIAVAAGNHGHNLDTECNVYPACYKLDEKLFHVVGRKDRKGNNGSIVKWREDGDQVGVPAMSGTSQATAIHMNNVLLGIK